MKYVSLIVGCICLVGCGGNGGISPDTTLINENHILVADTDLFSGIGEVLVVDVSTGDVVRELPFLANEVILSPDRKRILLSTSDSGAVVKTYDVASNQVLTSIPFSDKPTQFGPGPDRFSFKSPGFLQSAKFDGSDPIQYISDLSDGSSTGVFSPNGERIVSVSNPAQFMGAELQLRNNRGQFISTLYNTGSVRHLPAWSPDNRTVAFFATSNAGSPRLMAVDTQTSLTREISNFNAFGLDLLGTGRDSLKISWSPKGDALIFTAFVEFTRYPFYIKADGTGLRLLGNLKYTGGSVAWTN